jgi:hypothetical protein
MLFKGPFADCWRRLKRANDHRIAFMGIWDAITRLEYYRAIAEDRGDGTGIIRISHVTPIENDLALELGEFFYQLRAALDGAVFQAALMQKGEGNFKEDSVEFVIRRHPEHFKDASARHLAPISEFLKYWIEILQPYNSAKTQDTPHHFVNESLWLLNQCARKDRHRRLHVCGAVITSQEQVVEVEPPGRLVFVKNVEANILIDNSIILEFGVEGAGIVDAKAKGFLKIDVNVEEIPNGVGKQLEPILLRLMKAVQLVVEGFEQIVDM